MTDRYAQLVNSRPGALLARQLGLPRPVALERERPGEPVIRGRVLLGGAPGARLLEALAGVLAEARCELATGLEERLRATVAGAGLDATLFNPEAPGEQRFKALIFDATGIADSTELVRLHEFFAGTVRRVEQSGRVIVLGTPPSEGGSVREKTAQRALEGFTRSLGKEIGRGATVQLVLVAPGAKDGMASTLRFLLSPRSAYVSGQVLRLGEGRLPKRIVWERPLEGRTALVTGASRGIGEAIASTLAREGAHLVGLDVPGLGGQLKDVTERLGGEAIELDITAQDAPAVLAERFSEGLDLIVHNAGVTRDRTLGKMPAERWTELMDINLSSQERIDDALLGAQDLRENGRIVCVSSMSGIAGNAG
jgi:3-oxoacyl-[acyl-carrier protein] reductase